MMMMMLMIAGIFTAPVSGLYSFFLTQMTAGDNDDDDDDVDDCRHLHGPSVGPLLLLPDSDDSGQQPAPVAVHTHRRGRAGQNLHRGPGPARHSRSGSQSGN